mmetsp:Transcript_277/g.418  ORF Transcript_277/g.418 Transcript_277/m.418 type:complete len:85 (-) Transcript_277:105-359(-)
MDKVVDELAKGRKLERIMRTAQEEENKAPAKAKEEKKKTTANKSTSAKKRSVPESHVPRRSTRSQTEKLEKTETFEERWSQAND